MTDVIRNSSCPKVLPRRTLILMATATLTACATSPPDLQLSDDERNEVTQIGQYLNGLNSFQANFFQTGAFGDGTGTVWLDRPGRLRMDYAGSNAKTVVANNGRLVRNLDEQKLRRVLLMLLRSSGPEMPGPETGAS